MPLVAPGTQPWLQDTQSFSSFSGADIVATIGNRVFGNIQAIQYAVQREIAPVYVMGSPRPVAYARGKRAITGSLVFINFDQDALVAHAREQAGGKLFIGPLQRLAMSSEKFGMKSLEAALTPRDVGLQGGFANVGPENFGVTGTENIAQYLLYADQIPPFDITISFLNEMGKMAHLVLEFVQLVNEGMGMSIDDVVLEKAITFVACRLRPMRPGLAS